MIAVTLCDGLAAPTKARRLVAAAMADAGCPEELIERAVLVGSELVTNAVMHGTGAPRLQLTVRPDRARLAVYDSGSGTPEVSADPDQPTFDVHGRGMMIVGRQADRWGVDLRDHGKWVWAEFRVARRRRRSDAAAPDVPAAAHAAADTLRARPARRASARGTFDPVRRTAPA